MKYQISPDNQSHQLAMILEVVNLILLVIIAISFDYLVIDFLF